MVGMEFTVSEELLYGLLAKEGLGLSARNGILDVAEMAGDLVVRCRACYHCEEHGGSLYCARPVVAGEPVGSLSTKRPRSRVEARGFCKWGEPL